MADESKGEERQNIDSIINELAERKNDKNSARGKSSASVPQKRPSPNANDNQRSSKRITSSQSKTMETRSSLKTSRCAHSKAIDSESDTDCTNSIISVGSLEVENSTSEEEIDVDGEFDKCADVDVDVEESSSRPTQAKMRKTNSKPTTSTAIKKCPSTMEICGEKHKMRHVPKLIKVDSSLVKTDFIKKLNSEWMAADSDNKGTTRNRPNRTTTTIDNYKALNNDTVKLYSKPFKICVMQRFLENDAHAKQLVEEMCQMEWQRKQMDLYEFHQTTDLVNVSLNAKPAIKQFYNMLTKEMLPWMKKVTGLPLTHVSASCSMYNYGDFLLVHDDLLTDRQIAFVYYLTPWQNAENWTEEMGGALELFECDSTTGQPKYPIVKKFSPRHNQFVFFRVCQQSFHQVGEVTNLVYPRLTINGWFHGPSPKSDGSCSSSSIGDNTSNSTTSSATESNVTLAHNTLTYNTPLMDELNLTEWINTTYLKQNVKEYIQQHIEEKSEASLEMFLIRDFYDLLVSEFKENNELEWVLEGPANQRKYETLRFSAQSTGPPKDLHTLFTSKSMFSLLHQYTELDFDGPNTKTPTCSVQICRFTQGYYTLLGDSSTLDESALDVILFFNAKDEVGTVIYLSPDGVNECNMTGDIDASSSIDWSEVGVSVGGATNATASSIALHPSCSSRQKKKDISKNASNHRHTSTNERLKNKSNSSAASFLATSGEETGADDSSISFDPYEDAEVVAIMNHDVTTSSTAAASFISETTDDNDDDDSDDGESNNVQDINDKSVQESDENDEDDNAEEKYDDLAREDVLLTVHPKNNSLNLVYRLNGQTKFVKYVSKNSINLDEYVYILFATFKE